MFSKIQQWRAARRARRVHSEYEAGFSWACLEILSRGKSIADVEAMTYGQTDPFDRGANEALRVLSRSNDRHR